MHMRPVRGVLRRQDQPKPTRARPHQPTCRDQYADPAGVAEANLREVQNQPVAALGDRVVDVLPDCGRGHQVHLSRDLENDPLPRRSSITFNVTRPKPFARP
ncbi:hypothetical protein SSPO_057090 [Streptomyces antimycoticus]|uniref:Uncharacterized protein n=1 Tax=Streptomyces antimycoticus TaxID=68175 RepID=A0A499V0C3_9ACTN|nr:hypothetical protein SSPO_057090 [Streptomyces antimycoticus]